MSTITMKNPTERNTEARVVDIGNVRLFFSYETLIAIQSGEVYTARRDNVWSPTTGRHINEMGIAHFPIVDEDELEELVFEALETAC